MSADKKYIAIHSELAILQAKIGKRLQQIRSTTEYGVRVTRYVNRCMPEEMQCK